MDAECFPVFTWQEFVQAEATFLDEDTAVAVNPAVFGKSEYRFATVALSDDLPKAKTGPKPTLDKCAPETWAAIAWIAVNWTYPKAVAFAASQGIKTDRNAIYYRLNRQTKAAIKAAIGNEGTE